MTRLRPLLLAAALATTAALPTAQSAIAYRLSFSEREHRVMDVDVTFADVPDGPLELRISRTSPGRYVLHEFAKNVFGVRITDLAGRPLAVTRPSLHEWNVNGHRGAVRVQYRVFGDRVDGTYVAIDSTHAHINMPAAIMWARGLEMRPATVRFEPPEAGAWKVATQLLPGRDQYTFTAPNLQFLMDSPSEFSAYSERRFTIPDGGRTATFRVVAHHAGEEAELDTIVRDVEALVREMRTVFGEYPAFEGDTYTFIVDYLPWAQRDAMEHRNSTVITAPQSLRGGRAALLDSAAHEFFHVWNVERIRPQSLEPFNFEAASMADELWFAEGFTNYFGPLVLSRAGLLSVDDFAYEMGAALDAVLNAPGRQLRTPIEMSQLAPFVDAATSIDRTNLENTYVSYYTWGQVIALTLDLTLRARTDGRVTLDHYMRRLWDTHGNPGAPIGYVAAPYTLDDLRRALAAVASDEAFAADFFARYIAGREVADLKPLLERAGLRLRPAAPGRAFAGAFPVDDAQRGARVTGLVPFGSPAYQAGLERDDIITSIGAVRVAAAADVDRALASHKPGEAVPVTFERRGRQVTATLRLVEDPRQEIVPAERAGVTLTEAQRRFRAEWFGARRRNAF